MPAARSWSDLSPAQKTRAVVGGVIQLPSFWFVPDEWRHKLESWLHPVVEAGEAHIT